ncbi:MAG: glycosyltransferase family 4 protein [Acidobacteriaceae bacterium]|nr:glycosyltransferase family 4 protein [Acidobacteriaceae bacterium]
MRIALDATYSISPQPSGIAIYSRELMEGLDLLYPGDEYIRCFRPKQFVKATVAGDANVRRRVLLPRVKTFRADVFHALNQRADARLAKRVVSTFHDLFVMTSSYSTPDFRQRFTRQARIAASNSDLIIAVSRFTADQLMSLLGVEAPRIRIVPHGVYVPQSVAMQKREQMILFVGALQVRKNIANLVRAFENASLRGWRLVLAGAPNGFGAEEILNRIGRSPARDQIEITGYLSAEKLENLYRRASTFAFPSLDEGFGIPVLEAMAHGVPVMTSNRSGTAEVAGDAALLVNPENIEEMCDALKRLTADSDLREDLSRKGLVQARSYPWERTIRETYKVYEELAR